MLAHLDSSVQGAYPLSQEQSRALLQLCRRLGAATFTVNFLYVNGEESELSAKNFFQRISGFSSGERVLENVYGNGFQRQECWMLTDESIEIVLTETAGNLFAYNILRLPEEWLFYADDAIILQVVSHEQEITLRLSNPQYAEFAKLKIPHKIGAAKWSGLPESPIRTEPRRLTGNRAAHIKRRIEISLLCGMSITLALTLLSLLAVRFFPYRDLPMMPKPFFMYALSPGILAYAWFSSNLTGRCLYFVANSMVYALAVFCVIATVHAAKARS